MCFYRNSTLEIIISNLWKIMKTNKQKNNKQANKNKAKLKFYKRIKFSYPKNVKILVVAITLWAQNVSWTSSFHV